MLKRWKHAWKAEESSRTSRPHVGHDSDQDTQLSGTSSNAPPLVVVEAVPQNSGDPAFVSIMPPDPSKTKRSTRDTEMDVSADDRPVKRPRISQMVTEPLALDFLRNHLPEVTETSHMESLELERQILDYAKHENTIAVVTSPQSAAYISTQLLTWAVGLERSHGHKLLIRLRTAIYVVDDYASIDKHATMLARDGVLDIGRYSDFIHLSSPDPWSQVLEKDVVVVPANLLLDSLLRGILAVTQLHIVLISEAQNIKDQDSHPLIPIVKVMNDFYRVTDALSRPKIFAVVNSPPGRRVHFDSGMLKLESTLDAKVFGVTEGKRAEILALPDCASDIVVIFDPPFRTVETKLFNHLHYLDPLETIFRRHFRAARYALREVGACGSDLVWRRALKDIEASVPEFYEEDEDSEPQPRNLVRMMKVKASIHDVVKNWAFTMPNLDSSSRGFNVTPKFLRLVQILKSCKAHGEAFRGIIFVQRRAIALVLADLLRTLDEQVGFLRPYALIGRGPSATPHHQLEVFRNFATGTYNLLLVTKSAEDLDIPKASIVIRFDPFESQVSNAYVRAHTRGRESHLVHMIERGNDAHRRILSQVTQLDKEMLRWTETVRHTPRSSVPPSSLRETTNPYHSESEDEDGIPGTFLKDPTTSGRIYLQDATTVIYRFMAQAATQEARGVDDALFQFQEELGEPGDPRAYKCTVLFPGTSIEKVSGPSAFSLSHARRAACYEACVKLSGQGLLDYRLYPLPSRLTAQYDQLTGISAPNPIMSAPQARDAENRLLGTRCYPRKAPDFWSNTGTVPITWLYPTIISTNHSDEALRPHAPILILTRQALPQLSTFKLFFSGVPAIIRLRQGARFQVSEDQLRNISKYTIRICRTIANQPFVCSPSEMQYFFAPLEGTWQEPNNNERGVLPIVADHIPWGDVERAAENTVMPLNTEKLEDDIKDAVIQDRWVEFTRRYDALRIRHDLNPMSKPLDSPREAQYDNLLEYCKARRKDFEGLQNNEQPLIEVSKVPTVLNRLNPTSRPLTESNRSPAKYLIPELCAKFTIPASTLRTALLLPSITRRIDDFLLVKELNAKFFDHSISEALLHIAISAPSAGVEYDYERLELLGDAFLKYLSSIYVFVTNPRLNEGSLHVARQRIISNKSLLQNGSSSGLPPYIQAKPFTLKAWQPPNFKIQPSHSLKVASMKQTQSDDSQDKDDQTHRLLEERDYRSPNLETGHFDVLDNDELLRNTDTGPEAVINADQRRSVNSIFERLPSEVSTPRGVSQPLKTEQQAEEAVSAEDQKPKRRSKKKRQQDEQQSQWLGDKAIADVAEAIIGAAYISGGREVALKATKALNIPIPNVDRWSDFSRKVLAPSPEATAKLRPGSIEAVEKIIGHRFTHPHMLAQALTHASIQGYESTSYERLEFIGDAILDFMVIRHIFDRDQQLSPGGLTLLKGSMVSNSALAAVCIWSGLQEHLLFESYQLANSIHVYANDLKVKQVEEYKSAKLEGRAAGQYWLEIEPPKALSDVVESIIGAIYISDDFSPIGAEALFDNVLKPFYDQHITLKTLSHHPTKILLELFQAQGCQQFEISKEKDAESTRCDVIVHGVILASAIDISGSFAARRASFSALDALEGDAEFLTRTCDCRAHMPGKKAQTKGFEQLLSQFGEDEEANTEEQVDIDTSCT